MIINFYNAIYDRLVADQRLLAFMGLTGADNKDLSLHIQKRQQPSNIIKNLPLITYYQIPGRREPNHLVYVAQFVFDIYTRNNVVQALNIAQCLVDGFEGKFLDVPDAVTLRGEFTNGYEVPVDIDDVYCYSIHIDISTTIESNSMNELDL